MSSLSLKGRDRKIVRVPDVALLSARASVVITTTTKGDYNS
jgi:hypothetical protein